MELNRGHHSRGRHGRARFAGLVGVLIAMLLPSAAAFAAGTGHLIVDPANARWLRYSGGGRFFMCGPGDPEGFLYRGTLNPDGTRNGDQMSLIQKLAPTGANSIYMQIIRSHGGDGDPTQNPFIDHDPAKGLNPAILDQWETWFTAMDNAGITIFLFLYDDSARIWNTGDNVGPEETAFIDGIVNRFEHHDHLIWVVAEEYQEKFSALAVKRIAATIRAADDFDHPIAVHKLDGLSFSELADDPNIDQFAIQYNHADPGVLHAGVVKAWGDAAGRYNLNLAEAANWGAGATARHKSWAAAMGGAYAMALGQDIASTAISDLEDCGHLRTFMEATDFESMAPRDDLAAGATRYVLADPGHSYIAYTESAGDMALRSLTAGTYALHWMETTSGRTVDETRTSAGGNTGWTRPGSFGNETVLYAVLTAAAPAPSPPAAPTSLTASATSSTSIQLAWTDNASDETDYRVEQKIGSGTFAEILTLPAGATSTTVSGLAAETTYGFRVRAHNDAGFSSYSNTASATTPPPPPSPPAAPTGLTAGAASASSIQLSWTDNASDETDYRVEQKTGSGTFAEILTLPAGATSTTVSGLAAETTYGFRVRAHNDAGFSSYSNTASATTPAPPPSPPAAPSGLAAGAASSTSVQLAWTDNASSETDYRVEQKTGSGTFAEILTLPAGATSTTVSGLAPKTAYGFRVRAHNDAGFSSYSNTASATTPAPPPSPPAAPSGLSAKAGSSSTVDLAWSDNASDETDYRVEQKTGSGTFAEILTLPAGATSTTVSGLAPKTTYDFRVRAHNDAGFSSYSNIASATTKPGNKPPAPPGRCHSGKTTLCLQGSRFQVTVRWKNQHDGGSEGTGQMLVTSDQTGRFWFFGPQNTELLVKVLDGRPVNGSFWVFYASLTDVEFWITVTDTATGQTKTYHNLPGTVCGMGDTTSFDGESSAAAGAVVEGLPAASPASSFELAELAAPADFGEIAAAATSGSCTADAQTLCLLQNRFAVMVDFIDQHNGDRPGTGQVFPSGQTDETGYFWFFNPENLELAVKVLDGRAINGRFWVFYAGLSDLEYVIRVTDTVTGQVRAYGNRPGNICGRAHTQAF